MTNSERLTDQRIRLTLEINPQAAVFEGHFVGQPILPGVAQIDWAARLARQHLGGMGAFTGMKVIKFHRVIQPSMPVSLALDWQAGNLFFDYRSGVDGPLCSSGCLCFA